MELENSNALVDPNPPTGNTTRRSSNPRARLWCFTLFVGNVSHVAPSELPEAMAYLHFQEEICPVSGRHHYQGFVKYTKQLRMPQAKALVQSAFRTTAGPHMSLCNGSISDNKAYCSKVESRVPGTLPVILGECPTHEVSGKPSSTVDIVKALVVDKLTPLQALKSEDVTNGVKSYALRYAKTWNLLLAAMVEDRDTTVDPTVIVLYGVPGSGKTRMAMDMYPDAYIKSSGTWWDYYNGEKVTIYDDFDGSFYPFGDWKRIVDRYKTLVNLKGAMSRFSSTVHVITTNVYPSHWWSLRVTGQGGRDAIWRRISQVWYFMSENRPAIVYDDPEEFRALPMNFTLEQEDPKGHDNKHS